MRAPRRLVGWIVWCSLVGPGWGVPAARAESCQVLACDYWIAEAGGQKFVLEAMVPSSPAEGYSRELRLRDFKVTRGRELASPLQVLTRFQWQDLKLIHRTQRGADSKIVSELMVQALPIGKQGYEFYRSEPSPLPDGLTSLPELKFRNPAVQAAGELMAWGRCFSTRPSGCR